MLRRLRLIVRTTTNTPSFVVLVADVAAALELFRDFGRRQDQDGRIVARNNQGCRLLDSAQSGAYGPTRR